MICSMALSAHAAHSRQIEFKNIPAALIADLHKKFPQAFLPQLTYADLDQLMQELMDSGKFEDVTIESDGGSSTEKIMIVGRAIRRLQSFNITGIHELSRSDVQDVLGLQVGDIFVRKKLVDGAEKLKARYGEMGFFNAVIEINFDVGKDNEIVVRVEVIEGQPCAIHEIVIDTPNKILHEALMHRVARHLRRPLTEARTVAMRDTIESYFSSNRYLNAQISTPQVTYNDEKTSATVTYKIENPFRYELIFDGNQALTSPTILRHLDLENYSRTTLNPPLDISNHITDIYRELGYAFAQVEYKEKPLDKFFLKRVYYKIKEGHRVRLSSVEVTGQISRDQDYYASFVRDNSTDLINSGYYNRQGLDLGLKNLQIELQNQGYLRSKVMSVRVNFSDDKKKAFVTLNLDEGPLTRLTSITFKGNTMFTARELAEVLTLKDDAPLRLANVETSIDALKNFYTAHGYLDMTLLNENQDLVKYTEDNTRASIEFDISEGPKVQVARIVLEGNQITKNYVILREIDFKEGDTLTPQHIAESSGRLQRLGLFSQVSISTVEQGTPIADRTVVISVVEANPGIFNSGVGFDDEANLTYRGFLGVTYRNLGGTARAFSSRVELSYKSDPRLQYLENRVQLAYFEPFILNSRWRSRLTYTHADFVSTWNSTFTTVMIQQSDDAKINLERDLSLHTKLTWTLYGIEHTDYFEKHNQVPESEVYIGTIGPTVDIDYRDNPFNPSSGSFTRLMTEYSDPYLGSYDTVKYIKSDAQYTKYHRPWGNSRIVWANQVRGGVLDNLSDKDGSGVPYEKAFFLGGRSTVRGFEPATERFPRPEQLNMTNDPNFVITNWVMPTRSEYFLVKSEVRFPIYGSLGGAIFYDGGAVYIEGIPIDEPYRDAVGVGIRFSTPVGPVNLEYGLKLNRETRYQETPGQVDFSIGTF
jgi:outer membrane protein assembly complex protein YaeT